MNWSKVWEFPQPVCHTLSMEVPARSVATHSSAWLWILTPTVLSRLYLWFSCPKPPPQLSLSPSPRPPLPSAMTIHPAFPTPRLSREGSQMSTPPDSVPRPASPGRARGGAGSSCPAGCAGGGRAPRGQARGGEAAVWLAVCPSAVWLRPRLCCARRPGSRRGGGEAEGSGEGGRVSSSASSSAPLMATLGTSGLLLLLRRPPLPWAPSPTPLAPPLPPSPFPDPEAGGAPGKAAPSPRSGRGHVQPRGPAERARQAATDRWGWAGGLRRASPGLLGRRAGRGEGRKGRRKRRAAGAAGGAGLREPSWRGGSAASMCLWGWTWGRRSRSGLGGKEAVSGVRNNAAVRAAGRWCRRPGRAGPPAARRGLRAGGTGRCEPRTPAPSPLPQRPPPLPFLLCPLRVNSKETVTLFWSLCLLLVCLCVVFLNQLPQLRVYTVRVVKCLMLPSSRRPLDL